MRFRPGALIAMLGAAGLAGSLFLEWYASPANGGIRVEPSAVDAFQGGQDMALFTIAGVVIVLAFVSLFLSRDLALIPVLIGLLALGATGLVIYNLVEPPEFAVVIERKAGGYLALVACGVILVGAIIESIVGEAPHYKRCPDCASRIRAEARVCLRCGWRQDRDSARV